MDHKEAVELSYKLWVWLFQNPDKEKKDSPYWEEIKDLQLNCLLCAIFNVDCIGCPLNFKDDCAGGAYGKWVDRPISCRKAPAARIASILRRELRRLKDGK